MFEAHDATRGVRLRKVEDRDLDVLFDHQADPQAVAMAAFPARAKDQFARALGEGPRRRTKRPAHHRGGRPGGGPHRQLAAGRAALRRLLGRTRALGPRRGDTGARPARGRGDGPAPVRPCRGAQRRLDPRPGEGWVPARSRRSRRRGTGRRDRGAGLHAGRCCRSGRPSGQGATCPRSLSVPTTSTGRSRSSGSGESRWSSGAGVLASGCRRLGPSPRLHRTPRVRSRGEGVSHRQGHPRRSPEGRGLAGRRPVRPGLGVGEAAMAARCGTRSTARPTDPRCDWCVPPMRATGQSSHGQRGCPSPSRGGCWSSRAPQAARPAFASTWPGPKPSRWPPHRSTTPRAHPVPALCE